MKQFSATVLSCFLVLILQSIPAWADSNVWLSVTVKNELSSKWSAQVMPLMRIDLNGDDVIFWQIKNKIDYHWTKNFKMGFFYAYIQLDDSQKTLRPEHRLGPSITLLFYWNLLKFQSRTLQEIRFLKSNQFRAKWRFRQLLGLSLYWFFINNDLFLDYNAGSFNQNRLSLGIIFPISPLIKIKPYYLLQSLKKKITWKHIHIAGLSFIFVI